MLNDYMFTTCIVIGFNEEPGTKWGYQVNVRYYVNEIQYHYRASVSSKKCKIGDKYRIKCSTKDPSICEILWDEKVSGDSDSIR